MARPPELTPNVAPSLAANESAHSIALGERLVPYVLRRARRRTIGLSIDHRGLRVGAPQRTALRDVEALIRRHADWVAQKLDAWALRPRPQALAIVDGARLPLLGRTLTLRLALGGNRVLWNEGGEPTLTLLLRSPIDAGRVLEKALRERARTLFAERLAHYAGRLAHPVPALALSAARTRWGSCSTRSGIRLNWRLIHFPRDIVDYVVAHEVAHLREMNHSTRFWALVGQLYPDYATARQTLRKLAADCPHW